MQLLKAQRKNYLPFFYFDILYLNVSFRCLFKYRRIIINIMFLEIALKNYEAEEKKNPCGVLICLVEWLRVISLCKIFVN